MLPLAKPAFCSQSHPPWPLFFLSTVSSATDISKGEMGRYQVIQMRYDQVIFLKCFLKFTGLTFPCILNKICHLEDIER